MIGLIVDGEGEYRSLPFLIARLNAGSQVLRQPLLVNTNGNVPTGQIAAAIKSRLPILAARGATRAVVLIDRETNPTCPGKLATEIADALRPSCGPDSVSTATVVVKNHMFENWLIADVRTLTQMRARFQLTVSAVRLIQSGRADAANALAIIKRAAIGTQYDKVVDAVSIMKVADPLAIAANSRSFRKLLRTVQHPLYRDQSRRAIR